MRRAGPVPPPRSGGLPLSVLVDFDGTVAATDVTDVLLSLHATDPSWRARDEDYVAGRAGSRTLLAWDATILDPDPARLLATARSQPLDPGFAAAVEFVRAAGGEVEVVSDGLGFYVEPLLARAGAGDLPVATSSMDLRAVPYRLEFPYGHPACLVCGTCKRGRVLAHQDAGRYVVFVGDGESDRYAAWHADLVLAKGRLAALCKAQGWPYRAWRDFAGVRALLGAAIADGTVPPTEREVRQRREAVARRGFICGPEAWGPGRTAPPPTVR